MKKNIQTKTRHKGAFAVLWLVIIFLFACLPFGIFGENGGGRYALSAVAAEEPKIAIRAYDVDMTVQTDRKIIVNERAKVEFLTNDTSMFYKSLPLEGDRFYDIKAKCEGNAAFDYYVEDNEYIEDFMDICCVGGVYKGAVWTYEISYVMEIGVDDVKNGMILDVVGFGTAVEMYNVTATVHLPDTPVDWGYVCAGYGQSTGKSQVDVEELDGGKTIRFSSDVLYLAYSERFSEWMAEGITLQFELEKGVLDDFTATRIFTEDMWKIALSGVAALGLAIAALFLTKKKREMIPVVNVTAPDSMDPMKMGKLLDGSVDTEDITSMIYYFAEKGYLSIDMEDEDNPVLIKQAELPETASAYEKTLFKGLFQSGERITADDLQYKFFESAQRAKAQLVTPKMYERKSIFGYLFGSILGVIYAFILSLAMGGKVGGGYVYVEVGMLCLVPIVALLIVNTLCENYRYKWKASTRVLAKMITIGLSVVGYLLIAFFMNSHVMTEYEILVVGAAAIGCAMITSTALTREEAYCKTLGDIVGFKDFIQYTEEDKIKEMLEIDPKLCYKVLPYAQVLGVTNEWEKKFASIVVEPPTWCVGYRASMFDYILFHRCMTHAMVKALARQSGSVGRSGGGGSFGGFGGGGHGGGGFGAR